MQEFMHVFHNHRTFFLHNLNQIIFYVTLPQTITISQKLISVKHKPKPPVVHATTMRTKAHNVIGMLDELRLLCEL